MNADESRKAFVAVNAKTCMPVYTVANLTRSDDGDALSLFRSFGRPAAAEDEAWAVAFYVNSTGNPPPAELFTIPEWCNGEHTDIPLTSHVRGGGAERVGNADAELQE